MKPEEKQESTETASQATPKKASGMSATTAMYIGMFGGGFIGMFVPLGEVNPFTKAILFAIVGGIIGQFVLSGKKRRAVETAGRPHGPCCVSCEESIEAGARICPKCGWTQPE